jgi:hypothetical protein
MFRTVSSSLAVERGGAIFVDGTAEAGRAYTYRFALWRDGVFAGYTPSVTIVHGGGPAADAIPRVVTSPNPAPGGPIAISFRLARPQPVRLDVYDASGRRVADLGVVEGAGDVRVEWDGAGADARGLPDGVYFLRVEGEDFRTAAKITRLR